MTPRLQSARCGAHEQRADDRVRAARLVDDGRAIGVELVAEAAAPSGERPVAEVGAAVDDQARGFAAGVRIDDADLFHCQSLFQRGRRSYTVAEWRSKKRLRSSARASSAARSPARWRVKGRRCTAARPRAAWAKPARVSAMQGTSPRNCSNPCPRPSCCSGSGANSFAFGGVLDIPTRRVAAFLPWAARFAGPLSSAQRTRAHLAPFVRPAVPALIGMLREIGRPDLIRQHGHYELWLGRRCRPAFARTQAQAMSETDGADRAGSARIGRSRPRGGGRHDCRWPPSGSRNARTYSIHSKSCGHSPARPRSAAQVPAPRSARVARHRRGVQMITESGPLNGALGYRVHGRVVGAACCNPSGLKAPLEAARGYHVQMPARRHSPTP